ncbi:MAG: hypothetical protein IT223_03270, partial [Crocinitomicaceae bacterium]|nr:hypothetical protein [Crocinitomicaceae bacterium]
MKHFTTLPKFRALMGMTLMAAGTLYSDHLLSQDGVSINTSGNAPATSAALDVDYADKGVLIPRIALTGTSDVSTIPSPATRLLVYNNGSGGLSPAGFYYWNGSAWTAVGGGGGGGGTTINCSSPSEDMTAVYNNGQWECNDVLEIDPTWNAVSINSFGGPSSSYELLVDGDTYITDGLRVGTTTSPPTSGILSSGDIKINTSSNSFVVGSTNITGSGASYISNGLSVGTSSSPPSNGLRTYGDIQA